MQIKLGDMVVVGPGHKTYTQGSYIAMIEGPIGVYFYKASWDPMTFRVISMEGDYDFIAPRGYADELIRDGIMRVVWNQRREMSALEMLARCADHG